jgi:hypothetical protein
MVYVGINLLLPNRAYANLEYTAKILRFFHLEIEVYINSYMAMSVHSIPNAVKYLFFSIRLNS